MRRRQTGVGLVELLVAAAIGLASTIVIFQVFSAFEAKKRTTTAGTEATENGLMALHAIERDARHAGYGLVGYGRGADRRLVCYQVTTYASGGATTSTLMPIQITDGGAGSDAITIHYSTSPFGATPARLIQDATTSAESVDIVVANTANGAMFQPGDYMLVAEPGAPDKPCTRLRVTGTSADATSVRLQHYGSDSHNPAGANNIFPSTGYVTTPSSPALVVNMGNFARIRYDIGTRALRSTDLETGASDDVADSIVMIQAQYGVSADPLSQDVVQWVDATGIWAAPSASEITRIKAVRIAVVSRSGQAERENVTGATCTTPGGTVSRGPCAWRDDTTDSPAPAISLESLGADWQRYRYRVFETVVPLRNVIWGDIGA